jgi:hypothetical protein
MEGAKTGQKRVKSGIKGEIYGDFERKIGRFWKTSFALISLSKICKLQIISIMLSSPPQKDRFMAHFVYFF